MKEQAPLIHPALNKHDIELYASAEFGGSKQDAQVHLGLCNELGAMPAAHGAIGAGLHGHHVSGVERFVEFLRSIGLPAGWPCRTPGAPTRRSAVGGGVPRALRFAL